MGNIIIISIVIIYLLQVISQLFATDTLLPTILAATMVGICIVGGILCESLGIICVSIIWIIVTVINYKTYCNYQ